MFERNGRKRLRFKILEHVEMNIGFQNFYHLKRIAGRRITMATISLVDGDVL